MVMCIECALFDTGAKQGPPIVDIFPTRYSAGMTGREQSTEYALNVWFSLLSEDDGKETGYWLIDIYELMVLSSDGAEQEVENERKKLADQTIYLTPEEAQILALGSDEDFWLHTDEFIEEFDEIPERVAALLFELPSYRMEVVEVDG